MNKKTFLVCAAVSLLVACTTPPPPAAPEPEPEPVAAPKVSQTTLSCRAKYRRFRELGVKVEDINEILERGLLETDFISGVSNEAFQVLAEARELGCRY